MQSKPMSDYNPEILERYRLLFNSDTNAGSDEIAKVYLDEILKRYSGGFGSYAYAVMDLRSAEFLYASDNIDYIWGYSAEEFLKRGLLFYRDCFPQTHQELQFNLVKALIDHADTLPPEELLYSIANMDNIIARRKSELVRVLNRHIVVKLNEDGKIWLMLSIYTDISHIKKPDINHEPRLSYYIPKTDEFLIYNPSTESLIDLNILSKRERDIIRLSAESKTAEEIAQELFLSPYTIQTHRSNILEKTGSKNLAELVYFSKYHFST